MQTNSDIVNFFKGGLFNDDLLERNGRTGLNNIGDGLGFKFGWQVQQPVPYAIHVMLTGSNSTLEDDGNQYYEQKIEQGPMHGSYSIIGSGMAEQWLEIN